MTARKKFFLFILLVVGCAVIAGAFFLFQQAHRKKPRNFILISIDTCRADHLSCYGFPQETTPNIDAFAEEGVLFEHVVTPVPMTLPAHSSMLTGTIPPYHRVHNNLDYRLADDNVTLAELMKEVGFNTAGFVSSFVLDERFGIDQGFDFFDDNCRDHFIEGAIDERNAKRTTALVCDWLEENNKQPFFLFVHYFDPHVPLIAPEPFASRFGSSPWAAYSAEIAYTDHHIGALLEKLKSLDLYESSLIIITSDHGEALGEHGESEHGYFIYDCSVRVPLIIKAPGQSRARRVEEIVGIVDIVPTVCSILGIEKPLGVRGMDLSRYIQGGTTNKQRRYLYSESLLPCDINCNPLLGVSSNGWKYIQTTREELYDLQRDPKELQNLAAIEPEHSQKMQKQLKLILDENTKTDENESRLILDEESRKRLASLGYVGGSAARDTLDFDWSKPDPKDLLHFFLKKEKIDLSIRLKKELDQAQQASDELIQQYPQVAYAHVLRGQIALHRKDWETAFKYFSHALGLDQSDFRACLGAGWASLALGQTENGMALLQKARQLNPDFLMVYFFLGIGYNQQGKYDEAISSLATMLEFEPDNAEVHVNFAIAFTHKGELKRAVKHLRSAVELSPNRPDIQLRLADNLNKLGDLKQAIIHYNEAIKLDPTRTYPRNELAKVYFKLGRVQEAVTQWKEALRLKPNWSYVLNIVALLSASRPEAEFYDPPKALKMAQKACELNEYKEVSYVDTLAIAYAATGQYEEAIVMAQKAFNMAVAAGHQDQAQQIKKRLQLYKNGQAYQEETSSR